MRSAGAFPCSLVLLAALACGPDGSIHGVLSGSSWDPEEVAYALRRLG